MKKIILLALMVVGMAGMAKAAYLENVPQTLVQPNGDTLHCFATGDEFYHYLHDAQGFTIVQNPQTGYFVYAAVQGGKLVPTQYVAGKVNPAAVGLAPHARISQEEFQQKRARLMANIPACPKVSRDGETNHGIINNIVVFIHLAGDAPFNSTYSAVNQMFNDSTVTPTYVANSMYNYFKYNSYNNLHVNSLLVPQSTNDIIVAYEDSHPREYYMPWSETNPTGYLDEETDPYDNRTTREQELLVRALRYIDDNHMIPQDLNIDYNEDGLVDNICFLVSGDVAGWADLLWPHKWCLYTQEFYLNDKLVWDFNFELSDNDWYFSNSCMSHEMSHTLGAPDLYHYSDTLGFTPVGGWDLMANNALVPQHWGAYMKYLYGYWVSEDDFPWISVSGKYTLNPVSSTTPYHIGYRIQSDDPNEYFVIEYRSVSRPFEDYLPASGAIIYRINSNFEGWGNADWNGNDILDEVYVYRPGGTTNDDGSIYDAAFSQAHNRPCFNSTTDPQPFLSSGYISSLNICEITSYAPDSLTFWYLLPGDTIPSEIRDNVSEMSIYPVPARTQFTVSNATLPLDVVQVFDMAGKCVYSAQPSSNQIAINVEDWAVGTYVLRVQTSAGVKQEKILVGR